MEPLTEDVARAILKEVQAGGYIQEIPTNDKKLFELANYWAEEAIKINKSGKLKGDKTVIAIVNIVNTHRFFTDEPVDENQKDPRSATKLELEHGLPTPKESLGEPDDMPADLTRLSDEEIRYLSSKFNYYLGRARYLLAFYENALSDAAHLRDDALRVASKNFIESYEGKITRDLLDIYSKEDESYKEYEKSYRDSQKNVNAYKALNNIYQSNIDRLSREATMRHNEWERSR